MPSIGTHGVLPTAGAYHAMTPRAIPVGGALAQEQMTFNVAMVPVPDFGQDGTLLEAALPVDVPVYIAGGKKLNFGKAAVPAYRKVNGTYVLTGLDDAKKPNRSALKLTYTASTGIFKGSFKLYATNEASVAAGKKPTLKKYTVNVAGFVVEGEGLLEFTHFLSAEVCRTPENKG